MFILPYTFVAGASFQKIRCQIATDYSVLAIVKLPFTTFGRGKINTVAIVLQKGGKCNKTIIYNADHKEKWKFDEINKISSKEIERGNWWSIRQELRGDKINIIRGNISSDCFVEMGQEILHCATKKGEKWKPSKRYYDDLAINKRIVKAKKGDVLINRIGKDAGYWYVNDIDNIAISDCLLLLRNTTKKMLNVLKRNSDNNGRLKITERGVSVPYITADDIKLLFHNEKDIINAR